MRRRVRLGWSLVPLLLLASSAAATFPPIPIQVAERDGIARRQWPLTVSVPLPRGALTDANAAHVADESGTALPTQARALATWPDGSIRWLLADAQVDLRPQQARTLTLRAGPPPAPARPLQVRDSAAAIAVDAGALRFSIARRRFALLDGLAGAAPAAPVVGPLAASLTAGDRRGTAETPRRIEVLDAGPLRARIALHGTYGNGFDYVIRVEAYAGHPAVRLWHTFIQRLGSAYVPLRAITLELPLGELAPRDYHYGVDGQRARHGDLGAGGLHLAQLDDATAQLDGNTAALRLAGWLEVESSRGALGVAARWLWQQYPQSINVSRTALAINLWAPEADAARAGIGSAKTHELALWLAPRDALPPQAGAALTAPLLGVVDPAWIARSGAWPGAIAPTGPGAAFAREAQAAAGRYLKRNATERWNDCGQVECTGLGLQRPRTGAFGMYNWGDWNFRGFEDRTKGTDSWGNLEYDTTQVLALTAAVSGDAALYDAMLAAARHYGDVDVIHAYPTRPEWEGMNHPKNPLHFSFELGGPDLGHTWTEGLVSAYWLSGDERLLATARGIADYLVRRERAGVSRGNPRQWGWPQIALLAVYEATGETRYRDAALAYATRGMAAHPPTASQQWKLGILADALAATHAATGDAAARAWLDAYVAAVMRRQASEDARAFPAVAYLAALTGDAAQRDAALRRVARLQLGNWGKPFSINGRIGFRIYSLLAAPPPPSAPAPPSTP